MQYANQATFLSPPLSSGRSSARWLLANSAIMAALGANLMPSSVYLTNFELILIPLLPLCGACKTMLSRQLKRALKHRREPSYGDDLELVN